jgi:hypothetical protein
LSFLRIDNGPTQHDGIAPFDAFGYAEAIENVDAHCTEAFSTNLVTPDSMLFNKHNLELCASQHRRGHRPRGAAADDQNGVASVVSHGPRCTNFVRVL